MRGYVLGVLTHTRTLDRHWGGVEILKGGFKIVGKRFEKVQVFTSVEKVNIKI